jgi:peptidoglycan/xylan/chitin deacetylase (PgdA/CDA1 family)
MTVFRGKGWGPERKAASVSFTFDNLGEAAELEMGSWPAGTEVGDHYSARQVVPELLKQLEGMPPVTFFIEGWNAAVYPDTLRSIVESGHEIGLHGWRHEIWNKQDEPSQRAVIPRSVEAMRQLRVEPRGFRPPGGQGTALLSELMRAHGLTYISEVGFGARVNHDLAHLPFEWRAVDGVFLEPALGNALGVIGADELGLEALVRNHEATMRRAKESGDHVAFVFHPFLLGKDPARIDALFELMEHARADRDIWLASCSEVAEWLLADSRSRSSTL